MTPLVSVRTSPAFERWPKKRVARHAELLTVYAEALRTLEADPYNRHTCGSRADV